MWLWAKRPPQGPQPHEVNQARLFGPLFHQKVLHMARCGGNHFLPLDSYSGQWKSCSQCMWPKVHIMNVNICYICISQIERVYMDPIKVRVHHEANLWQAQRNLVGMGKWGWVDDPGWFLMTNILPTWTRSTRGALGTNTQTWRFPFSHGFVFILMMVFISRMQVRWMGFMSLSL